jgi:two-component system, cell cycle sensor histidine kinase and response regulator CckA
MGSAYDHLSREQLLALLASQPAGTSLDDEHKPPASGDRYRQMVEEAADGIFVADSTGRYLDVNEVGARMMGMTRDEIIGKRVSDLIAETELGPLENVWDRVSAGEWVLREWRMRRKDGSVFAGEVSSKLLPDGRVQGILRDVSERREQEDALRESEQRFRALTAASFEGIGVTDRGVVLDANEQLARLLGYERSELLGKDVSIMVAPESREAVASAMRSGRETPYRHLAVRKDGSRIEVEAQAKMADWAGKPVRVTAIRDITERLQLEERLNRVQKLEALGRLAGGIAHDFNNILVAIFSYADLTDLDAEDPTQVRSHMEGLRAAAHRARDLVQQILTFSRQKGEERVRTPVRPIVDEALRFLRSTLPTSIQVRAEVGSEVPQIFAAPVQIHQVIMNLCVNAAHAMQKTGVLSVGLTQVTANAELLERAPELIAERSYVRLHVEDTGKGMDRATLERIFEPFFTTKASGEGSGLGLSVVHGVVKAHDGAITVDSVPGRGTRFEVYLPAAD